MALVSKGLQENVVVVHLAGAEGEQKTWHWTWQKGWVPIFTTLRPKERSGEGQNGCRRNFF